VFLVLVAAASLVAHDPIGTKVTWGREIAPIVQARCVTCHSAGGRAPMALTTYQEARPWARAIREEVLTRRMPKWHVVRGYGDFSNDPSLSAFEIALIAAWVDGGAPLSLTRNPEAARVASPPVPPGFPTPTTGGSRTRPASRIVRIPCASGTLARGRLIGLTPRMASGSSLRLNLRAEGGIEPVIWLVDFDPALVQTYWLRTPRSIGTGARLEVVSTARNNGPCRLDLHYAR